MDATERGTFSLLVTTRCDRRCPTCCCHIPGTIRWDIGMDEIERVGPLVGEVPILVITGGEPTAHPRIADVVRNVALHFRYGEMDLATNGDGIAECATVLHLFRRIRFTRYTAASYPGCADNRKALERARYLCPPGTELLATEARHATLDPERRMPCARGYTRASYLAGRVYPCCVAGIPGQQSVPLTAAWREEVRGVALPCDHCVFAT